MTQFYIATPSNIMFEGWALGIQGNVIPIQKRQLKWESFSKFESSKSVT